MKPLSKPEIMELALLASIEAKGGFPGQNPGYLDKLAGYLYAGNMFVSLSDVDAILSTEKGTLSLDDENELSSIRSNDSKLSKSGEMLLAMYLQSPKSSSESKAKLCDQIFQKISNVLDDDEDA